MLNIGKNVCTLLPDETHILIELNLSFHYFSLGRSDLVRGRMKCIPPRGRGTQHQELICIPMKVFTFR